MVSTVAERWLAMRALYETFGVGIDLLCTATGRSVTAVTTRVKVEGWLAPKRDANAVLVRMSSMLQAQLGELEDHVSAGGGADEKSVRTLGTLARTWEKLNALEQLMDKELDEQRHNLDAKSNTGQPGAGHSDDASLHALRLELEKRIAALVDRKSEGRLSESAVAGEAERSTC